MSERRQFMNDFNPDDYPLPDWADKRSDGEYMEVGAQLATKDGRYCGNAFVNKLRNHDELGQVADVITDAGNKTRMTLAELESAFYPPIYVMNVGEARRKFIS